MQRRKQHNQQIRKNVFVFFYLVFHFLMLEYLHKYQFKIEVLALGYLGLKPRNRMKPGKQ